MKSSFFNISGRVLRTRGVTQLRSLAQSHLPRRRRRRRRRTRARSLFGASPTLFLSLPRWRKVVHAAQYKRSTSLRRRNEISISCMLRWACRHNDVYSWPPFHGSLHLIAMYTRQYSLLIHVHWTDSLDSDSKTLLFFFIDNTSIQIFACFLVCRLFLFFLVCRRHLLAMPAFFLPPLPRYAHTSAYPFGASGHLCLLHSTVLAFSSPEVVSLPPFLNSKEFHLRLGSSSSSSHTPRECVWVIHAACYYYYSYYSYTSSPSPSPSPQLTDLGTTSSFILLVYYN